MRSMVVSTNSTDTFETPLVRCVELAPLTCVMEVAPIFKK